MPPSQDFLVIQWLRFRASTAGGAGSMVQDGATKKKKRKERKDASI